MKLSRRNHREYQVLLHYMPDFPGAGQITDAHVESFFAWSNRGDRAFLVGVETERRDGELGPHTALLAAKSRRDLAVSDLRADWGELVNERDFLNEPHEVRQFLSRALKRPELGA